MKISAAQAYCILDTVGSSILTKSGEISVSYLLELPEAYSLDRSDLEERHNELFRAFQYVRTGFIHKQDVFLRRKFKPEYVIEGEGYIQTAERKYFDGREYLHHFCILSFTLSGLQSLEKAYQANPLAYSEKLAKADPGQAGRVSGIGGECSFHYPEYPWHADPAVERGRGETAPFPVRERFP